MPERTLSEKQALIKTISGAFAGLGLSARTQLLIIAHAVFESGWGVSAAAKVYNYFNITAGSSWKGRTIPGPDTAYDENGKVTKITQQWRVYDSPAEGVTDYLKLLQLPRYLPARAALMGGDPAQFVELLGPDKANQKQPVGGYYTLPTIRYMAGYNAVLAEVTKLCEAYASGQDGIAKRDDGEW